MQTKYFIPTSAVINVHHSDN